MDSTKARIIYDTLLVIGGYDCSRVNSIRFSNIISNQTGIELKIGSTDIDIVNAATDKQDEIACSGTGSTFHSFLNK